MRGDLREFQIIFGVAASLLSIIAFTPYVINTAKGKTVKLDNATQIAIYCPKYHIDVVKFNPKHYRY